MSDVRVVRHGACHTLHVDGAPFLVIGGELHNSSSSDPVYFEPIWGRLAESGINTVIVSVAWNEVEPVEGELDFSIVDALLAGAAAHSLRLVLIWFGAFKNAASTYAPSWVRRDRARFPCAVHQPSPRPTPFSYEGATPKPVLSVFSDELVCADERAFARLMQHLADHDSDRIVIMVQIENEVGLLGSSRDHSQGALTVWHSPVPDSCATTLPLQARLSRAS